MDAVAAELIFTAATPRSSPSLSLSPFFFFFRGSGTMWQERLSRIRPPFPRRQSSLPPFFFLFSFAKGLTCEPEHDQRDMDGPPPFFLSDLFPRKIRNFRQELQAGSCALSPFSPLPLSPSSKKKEEKTVGSRTPPFSFKFPLFLSPTSPRRSKDFTTFHSRLFPSEHFPSSFFSFLSRARG